MTGFNPDSPCLVLAPHLEYPARNGADILIDRKWSCFSGFVPYVDIVGRDTVSRFKDGRLESRRPFNNEKVSKLKAVQRAIFRKTHYLLEKFVTKGFVETASRLISCADYGNVVFSYIWTASLFEKFGRREAFYCVETHNDELKWFSDLKKTTGNPAAKVAAHLSGRWLMDFLKRHEGDFLFMHVSEADRSGYLEHFPNHRSIVVPVGVDMDADAEKITDANTGSPRLIFAGSLNVKMNLDALSLFSETFYPKLRLALGEGLEVVVAGSNPSKGVASLCRRSNWRLFKDVTDEEMIELYSKALFSILPFGYATGGKLKLFKSLANGVPFLATSAMKDQAVDLIYPCLVSDEPEQWAERAREVMAAGLKAEQRRKFIAYSKGFSWEKIAGDMANALKDTADTDDERRRSEGRR